MRPTPSAQFSACGEIKKEKKEKQKLIRNSYFTGELTRAEKELQCMLLLCMNIHATA